MAVKKLTQPGRYGDGSGLWLQVRSPQNRSWLFRYMMVGKARWLGLGDESVVSLAMARLKAAKAREAISNGIDPLTLKQAEKEAAKKASSANTFDEVKELFLTAQGPGWRNEKHRNQWRSTLATYATPKIGSKRIDTLTTDEILSVLEPIWTTKTETASRLRGRIESILNYARARGLRSGENPARWRGHLDHILAPKAQVSLVRHHPALAWADLPQFIDALSREEGTAAKAFLLLILTATRTTEVTDAHWGEIDIPAKTWTIPASRMKAGREHRVPLSDAAVAVLNAVQSLKREDGWVFPGTKKKQHLSNMAFLMMLRRMERHDITAHGFRSTFREWAAEKTSYPREIAEAALAHSNKDKVEAAYLRSDHFAQRTALMDDWSAFCLSFDKAKK
jgi:integrase